MTELLLIIGAYLVGSLPHLRWLARLRGISLDGDFHQELWHRGGRVWGVAGVIGEFVKGIVPVLVGRLLGVEVVFLVAAGVATVCGQMWPVFSHFDGEKGNSIAIAMSFVLAPLAMALAIIPVLISLVIRMAPRLRRRASGTRIIGGAYSRSLPLGMVACFMLLPVMAWLTGEPPSVYWGLSILFFLMIVIRRLTAGLSADLATGENVQTIIARRLLYDRSTVAWRQSSDSSTITQTTEQGKVSSNPA